MKISLDRDLLPILGLSRGFDVVSSRGKEVVRA